MKKILTIIAIAAVSLTACTKNGTGITTNGTVNVKAAADGNCTKVAFGELSQGTRPITWNAEGEAIALWEFVDETYVQDKQSSSYAVDADDASKATFNVALDETVTEGSYDYVAIYPYSSSRNGSLSQRTSPTMVSYALSVTATDMQCPTPTTPDPAWMVLTAKVEGKDAQQTALSLNFEHQTAYGRMTFKNFPALADGETLDCITVEGPTGKYFTGRRWYDYKDGTIEPYSATAQKNVFKIDPSGITANSEAFDIWFSVLPLTIETGENLKITAQTSANTYIADITLTADLSFKKGEIAAFTVNWSKYINNDKVIVFDFTTTPQEGWPSEAGWNGTTEKGSSKVCTFKVNANESYDLILAEPGFAAGCKIYWHPSGYFFFGKYRYLGLPKISGYALKTVKCTVYKQISGSAVAIMDHIYSPASAADPDSYAVAAQAWNVAAGTVMTYEVNATTDSQQYYIYCKNPSGGEDISKIELTYVPVE